MMNRDEIQRRHDQLIAIILNDIDLGFNSAEVRLAMAQCDVLCWVLQCDHGDEQLTFAKNLEVIDTRMKERNVVETKMPFPMRRRPKKG